MVGPGSKKWANDLLRWFLREILYAPTWENHPSYKIIVAKVIIYDLERAGFPWQRDRVINHLNRWKKKLGLKYNFRVSCKAEGLDTPLRREEVSS